jgi:sortase (surface protein transpeptidase)
MAGFDDILVRIESLRLATNARIAELGSSPDDDGARVMAAVASTPAELDRPRPRRSSSTGRLARPALAVAGAAVALVVVVALAPDPAADLGAVAAEAAPPATALPDPVTPIAPVIPPPAPRPSPSLPEPATVVRSVPVAIRIPAIEVDAPTVPVGLEPDGSMEIPSDVATIGWYEPALGLGVTPGQVGTAVLAGHVDSRTQGAGAFYFLRDLEVGDRIEIVHEDGTATRWRVTRRTVYAKDELPIEQVFVWTGAPRLALITCGGPFDWTVRSYADNVVVYAEPELSALSAT